MRYHPPIRTLLEWMTLTKVAIFFASWIFVFGLIYHANLHACSQSYIADGNTRVEDFWNLQYFSIITATTLGYGDLTPKGFMRVLAAIEVIGGLVFGGLAVSTIAASPLRTTRLALKECAGVWIERAEFKGDRARVFYARAQISANGTSLDIVGWNYDEQRTNDATSYSGELIANQFPTLIFSYTSDVAITDYTSGIYKICMYRNEEGHYDEYAGEYYDEKFGKRDQIRAYKVRDRKLRRELDDPRSRRTAMQELIRRFFPEDSPMSSVPTA